MMCGVQGLLAIVFPVTSYFQVTSNNEDIMYIYIHSMFCDDSLMLVEYVFQG